MVYATKPAVEDLVEEKTMDANAAAPYQDSVTSRIGQLQEYYYLLGINDVGLIVL